MPLILTTPTNPGTASWSDAADVVTASTFVLDVSAPVESANIYNNLDSLAAAVATVAGAKTVQIIVPAVLVPLPGPATGFTIPNGTQGPYNFGDCEFIVVNTPRPGNAVTIDFDDGVVFSELPYLISLVGASIRLPAGFYTTTQAQTALRVDGGTVFSKPALVTGGCIAVQAGHAFFASTNNLGAYSGWGDAPATFGLFDIAVGASASVRLYDQGQVGLKTASGAGTFGVTMGDANCTCERQTLLTGTLSITSPEHGLIVFNPTAGSSNNFRYNDWTIAYNVARGSAINLNRDAVIHVTGTTGAIPTGTWDLSNIILTGDPGAILSISAGADLSSTTQLRVSGHLSLRVDAGVATSPFVWASGTRTVQINDSASVNNLSPLAAIPLVPVITASGATTIRLTGAGSRYVPAATGGVFLSASGTVTTDIALTRAVQAPILLTAGTVGLSETAELQQKGTSAINAGTVILTDGSGNAFVQIPQYSTVLLQGTVTARGVTAGTVNAGSWTFATMITRDAAASTITAGAAATAVSAATYPTAPTWLLDGGSNGVRLQCTGPNSNVAAQWTANIRVTVVATGA